MKKTKIEWCDSTWNPVTGCLHDCNFCYARRIAERFSGYENGVYSYTALENKGNLIIEITDECPPVKKRFDKNKQNMVFSIAPYPFGFTPTLHRNRFSQPINWKKGRNIFVCSMADLFGEWVPEHWITDVFDICKANPQHRYLFLTKNPARYLELAKKNLLPTDKNMWYGTSALTPDTPYFFGSDWNTFLSIEPILGDYSNFNERCGFGTDWVIVGAETGNRKDKVIPDKSWIDAIRENCASENIPLMMKDSLIPIVGEENMVRQFPFPENGSEKIE